MEEYIFTVEELKVISDAASILTRKQDEYPEFIEAAHFLWESYNKDDGRNREFSEVI